MWIAAWALYTYRRGSNMSILGWVLFGFVVGLIARAVMPGRDPIGLIGTIVLGVIGALLGGWTGKALGWYGPDDGAGFLAATVGAVVLLFLYNVLIGRRRVQIKQPSDREDHRRAA
jgi:uncharacterized membrane protein YeaQ/YmgE (transglycosylase-associated protein family)